MRWVPPHPRPLEATVGEGSPSRFRRGQPKRRTQDPQIADFEIYSRGQSTQMSFINGKMSTSVEYSYTLVPKKEGRFQIPAISVALKAAGTSHLHWCLMS